MVTVGKIGKSFGVHGWFHIHSYTDPISNILSYAPWTLVLDDEVVFDQITPDNGESHHRKVVAHIQGYDTPEDTQALTHLLIQVPRERLPVPEEGTYYWSDLMGLAVIDTSGELLGNIFHIDNYGPHDVFHIKGTDQYIIPYVPSIVRNIDLSTKTIQVDWPKDATI